MVIESGQCPGPVPRVASLWKRTRESDPPLLATLEAPTAVRALTGALETLLDAEHKSVTSHCRQALLPPTATVPSMPSAPFPLFSRFGVELEYMVVDRDTLRVRSIVDRVLQDCAKLPGARAETEDGGDPEFPNDVSLGEIGLSNELTLHVLEMKTAEPAAALTGLAARFADRITTVNAVLSRHNAMLLPTGMHPTMLPEHDTQLWPHDCSAVYKAFNRIFDCRAHGWANLQAAHLNLPFATSDTQSDEFAILHAAIRVLLPILPALAASTPLMESRATGLMDTRLEVYRTNSKKIPQATARVIPEPVFTRSDYERTVLDSIYTAYQPHDPAGQLRHEWANSRGAIARFARNAIEIRVLDVQECPAADLAILSLISSVLRAMTESRAGFPPIESLKSASVDALHPILLACIRDADETVIDNAQYLAWLGVRTPRLAARELWTDLRARTLDRDANASEFAPALDTILRRGCLARRITRALGSPITPDTIAPVYHQLARCLGANSFFP